MKILLDENLPKKLKQDLSDVEVFTVFELGWSGLTNGKLLELMIKQDFEVLITFDKNLQYQQIFNKYTVAVIVLDAEENTYRTLRGLIPSIKKLLNGDLDPGPQIIYE